MINYTEILNKATTMIEVRVDKDSCLLFLTKIYLDYNF